MSQPIWVVGLGIETPPALSAIARDLLREADLVIGGGRQLGMFEDLPGEKMVFGANLDAVLDRLLQRAGERVVVLASGDPGFHGIGATLLENLPGEDIRILPHVTSLQAAFARAGVSWSDAVFASAHAHRLDEVLGWVLRAPKLGILTDQRNTPALIADRLLQAGAPDCRAIVAEDLGTPQESITDTRLHVLSEQSFSNMNVLLLVQDEGWRPMPLFSPRPEFEYAHRRGLITKADVRSLSLARLALSETDIVWDIGAGSGAMSVEMSEIAWRGRVYAVENDKENLGYIGENIGRFGRLNIEVIEGTAPEALEDLPSPQAVFIGGTGGQMQGIMEYIHSAARPGCRVVVNLATLDNLAGAMEQMAMLGWSPQVTQVSISHGQEIAGHTRLSPINPVFIVLGRKA
jgi:precorrin-6Y C5,15-methyltransferase (decarboxylating)